MGSHCLFKCHACGYQAEVSGRVGVGMACKTVTVVCSTCHELYDVMISEEPWEDGPDPTTLDLECPESHPAQLWTAPGPCPRCEEKLANEGLTVMWD